jgi:hypothetical protein
MNKKYLDVSEKKQKQKQKSRIERVKKEAVELGLLSKEES